MIYYWCLQLGYICIYQVSLCILFEFCSRCFFSRVITVNNVYFIYAFHRVTVAFSNKFIIFSVIIMPLTDICHGINSA